jgi:hypothetical protein
MKYGSVQTALIGRELSEYALQATRGGFDYDFTCGNEPRRLGIGPRPGPLLERAGGLRGGLFASDPDGDPVLR